MKSVIFVVLCAICACHLTDAIKRSKRTIGMLESIINSVRQTFSPTVPPPPDVILATKLPYGVRYTYYPTVRMHIRPVEKRIIYMKHVPSPTVIRHVAPMSSGDVEILRQVQPLLRLPKTKTTTTIHYEIIPVPLHLRPQPLPEPLSGPASFTENEEEGQAPWMDELPPPIATANPVDSVNEPMVPWHMHELPPPIPTKHPATQPNVEWISRPAHPAVESGSYMMPMVAKKLMIPSPMQATKLRYGRVQPPKLYFGGGGDVQFVPSPLHSEISVQPSIEVAAFSETESVAQHPRLYFNQLQDRSPKRTFQERQPKPRLRRDTSFDFPSYAEPSGFKTLLDNVFAATQSRSQTDHKTSIQSPSSKRFRPFYLPIVPPKNTTSSFSDSDKLNNNTDSSFDTSKEPTSSVPTIELAKFNHYLQRSEENPNAALDFGEYIDNDEADREHDSHSAHSEHYRSKSLYNDDSVTIVKAPEWFGESIPFVAITPKPIDFTRKLADNAETPTSRKAIFQTKYSTKQEDFKNVNLFESPNHDERRSQHQRNVPQYFESSINGDSLRFPETGLFSKSPKRKDNYQNLFPDKGTSTFASRFLDTDSDKSFKFQNGQKDKLPGFDYDNIEYFEPIIIDIDKEKQKANDFGPKLQFKFKNFGTMKSNQDNLRLPDNLHETMDFLQNTLMHPPIFDLEGESTEPKIIAILSGNEIT